VEGERIEVIPKQGISAKTRIFARNLGLSFSSLWGVHNNSLGNVLRGVRERVFYVDVDGVLRPPPRPAAGVFASRMRAFALLLLSDMPFVNPWDYDQFVGSYVGSQRLRYEEAVASLHHRPLSIRDAWVKAFVKAEKLLLSIKSDPAPRIISPRDPRFNVEVGLWIRPAEPVICRAIAKLFGGATVMKGYNAVVTAGHMFDMWTSFRDPVAIGLDASRFDQHVSIDALRWEHSVYLRMYGLGPSSYLAWLLSLQLYNKVSAKTPDGTVKYEVEGTRMSGDMNTSLGNCLIMCGMVHSYLKHVGVKARLANNGDDCVVFMERRDAERFTNGLSKWFLEMGFTMKVEAPVDVFEHVEFCQTKPVCVDGQYIMCRSPTKGLAKDSVCLAPDAGPNMLKTFGVWARGVGTAGCALASGMPIMQAAYLRMTQMGGTAPKTGKTIQGIGKHCGLIVGARGLEARIREPSAGTRFSFWLAWGITPDEQTALEDAIREWTPPTIITDEVSYQLTESLPIPS
jgi:hypothetical protein